MTFLQRLRGSFQTPEWQLTLGLCVLIVLLMGTYGVVLTVDRQQDLQKDAERHGLELARGLSLIGATAVLDNLFVVQEALTSLARRDPDILSVLIMDRDRMVIASDNPLQIGNVLSDDALLQAEAGGAEFVLEQRDAQGRDTLMVFEPLRADGKLQGWIRVNLSLERAWGEAYHTFWKQLLAAVFLLLITLYVFLKMVRRLKVALQASEEKYRHLVDHANDIIYRADANGRFTYYNPTVRKVLGYDENELIGRHYLDLVRNDYRMPTARFFGRQFIRRTPSTYYEFPAITKGGSDVWIGQNVQLVTENGRIIGFQAVARDITESKRAGEAIQREKEFSERLIAGSLDGILAFDCECRYTVWNLGMERITGIRKEETLGKCAFDVFPFLKDIGEDKFFFEALAGKTVVAENRPYVVPQTGRQGFFEGYYSPLRNKSNEVIGGLAIIREITERKRTELRLNAQHAITRILSESDTLETAALRILQAIGESLGWDVGAFWRVDQRARVLQCLEIWHAPSAHVSEFTSLTRQATFASGIGLPGRVWASGQPAWIHDILQDANFPRASSAAAVGLRGALAFPVMLGNEVYGVLEFFSHDLRPPDTGLLEALVSIGSQLGQFTERRVTEEALRRSEDHLRQVQKMEAIGRLAGGVAHDFNNLLTAIMGYSELSLSHLQPGDQARKNAEQIRQAAVRAAALTHQLLAFGRRQVLASKVLDLNAVATNLEPMLRRLIGEDLDLGIVPCPDLGRVQADPGQIEQVIMNLAINARDAMPRGGKLTIETANVELGEGDNRPQVPVRPGRYVLLAVSDTGCGMNAETQAHIFEPFFTTKEQGKGTGLGLATVYGIVKQSDGYIWVYSEPGFGTTFKIYLPRIDDVSTTAEPDEARSAPASGRETILLVEDEEAVRDLVRGVLEGRGYSVLLAQSGEEAVRLSGGHEGPIHLMVTDVVMPRMSGRELAERLASSRPAMKVLYISGYTDDAVVRHGVLSRGVAFLQKPFMPNALLRKVREVLDVSTKDGAP